MANSKALEKLGLTSHIKTMMDNKNLFLQISLNISERERSILLLRYGLIDNTEFTLEQIGNHYGVTRERIRQIEAKALRKMRHPSKSRCLKDYY